MKFLTGLINGLLLSCPFWILLFWAFSAKADVSIILGSHHFNAEQEYNEANFGLCYQHNIYLGCRYENSFNDPSTALGIKGYFGNSGKMKYGGTLAYVHGYDNPMVWVSLDLEWNHATLSFIPGELAGSKNILVYGVKF